MLRRTDNSWLNRRFSRRCHMLLPPVQERRNNKIRSRISAFVLLQQRHFFYIRRFGRRRVQKHKNRHFDFSHSNGVVVFGRHSPASEIRKRIARHHAFSRARVDSIGNRKFGKEFRYKYCLHLRLHNILRRAYRAVASISSEKFRFRNKGNIRTYRCRLRIERISAKNGIDFGMRNTFMVGSVRTYANTFGDGRTRFKAVFYGKTYSYGIKYVVRIFVAD